MAHVVGRLPFSPKCVCLVHLFWIYGGLTEPCDPPRHCVLPQCLWLVFRHTGNTLYLAYFQGVGGGGGLFLGGSI